MNIVTKGNERASAMDCRTYAACLAGGTPNGSGGFVWWPYSVTQISTFLRLNQVFRLEWRRGSDLSETFGHFTSCDGRMFGVDGYGWCDQASNLRRGLALATSSANLPGEWIGRIPVGLSLPR